MKHFLGFLLFNLFFSVVTNAQEHLVLLDYNPALVGATKPVSSLKGIAFNTLPFFDDFSTEGPFPSTDFYTDLDVYVNNSVGIGPLSLGVATFDAVDSEGVMYADVENTPALADQLTSQVFDLSAYSPADSLYFTFFYQPQGYGEAPEFNDILKLDFLTPDTTIEVWQVNGCTFESFVTDTLKLDPTTKDTVLFKMVHLNLTNPEFFVNGFQFRFSNYASTYSLTQGSSQRTNCDMWNIDYIYFDANRTIGDTIFSDVAFVEPPLSFIKTYSSVPWSHFDNAITALRKHVYYNIRNNDAIKRNLSEIVLTISDDAKGTEDLFRLGLEGSESGLDAFTNYFDKRYPWTDNFPVSWYAADSAVIHMKATLSVQNADPEENNTAYRDVVFNDYYAYDDGTAEFAYGILDGARKVAYYYETYVPDSLIGISFYFVPNKQIDGTLETFFPSVWTASEDKPGTLIYKEENNISVPQTEERNQFVTVLFSEPVYIDSPFFIGWEQNENYSLNVGFDANINTRPKRFYFYNGSWWQAGGDEYEGSLMMRPVFAKPKGTGIIDNQTRGILVVSPNPSSGLLQIDESFIQPSGQIILYNSIGKQVFQANTSSNVFDLSWLKTGLYIVQINNGSGELKSCKWMKQ